MNEIFNSGIPDSLNDETNSNPELAQITDLSKRGYQCLRDNRIEEAEECFARILEKDRQNNYALVGMGDASRKRNEYSRAVEFYKKCLVYHPGNNYALFGLADSYKALNQFQKAIEIWEQYLLHDDTNITVLTRVADAYRKVRDFKKSKAIYQRVLEKEDNNSYALIGLGYLYYDFREYDHALEYWQRMADLQKDEVDIRVLTSIGNCYRKLKQFDRGIPWFEKALDKEPSNFYALFGIADCFRGVGNIDVALDFWVRLLEKDGANKAILSRAGDACLKLGKIENAAEYFRHALRIAPDTFSIIGLAKIERLKGNADEAISALKNLVQNEPRNFRLYLELSECYIALKDKPSAVAILESFQNRGESHPLVKKALEEIGSRI